MDQESQQLVELSFQAVDIGFKGKTSQLKLFCDVNHHSYLVGETETASNETAPCYRRSIRIDLIASGQQMLKVQVWDHEASTNELLGEATAELRAVVSSKSGVAAPVVKAGAPNGQVLIVSRRVVQDKSMFNISVGCLNVKNTEMFGKVDPYLMLFRPYDSHVTYNSHIDIPNSLWCLIYKTEWVKSELNPKFNPFSISSWNLSRGNPHVLIKVEIWDHSKIGRDKKIGTAFTTLAKILSGADKFVNSFDPKNKFMGTVCFAGFDTKQALNMSEYLSLGISLRCFFAVNCSTSMEIFNKSYVEGVPKTLIETAVESISDALLKKQKNPKIGFLGFSALKDGCRITSFAFNQSERNSSVCSTGEVLELYKKLYPTLEPTKPTRIEPVIERVRLMIKYQDRNKPKVYSLLVVLTDGDIQDQHGCIDKIVECSSEPLSIVFVGIGLSNFHKLEFLESGVNQSGLGSQKSDAKQQLPRQLSRLKDSKGKEGCRSIVKFVYYQNYAGKQKELTEAIFRDLPTQMADYYNASKLKSASTSSVLDSSSSV